MQFTSNIDSACLLFYRFTADCSALSVFGCCVLFLLILLWLLSNYIFAQSAFEHWLW